MGRLPKSKVGNLEISRLQKARIAEIYGLLQHLLTVQGDHMSAGNSIETRTPFLNKDFVYLCNSIEPNFYFQDWFNEKKFLKNRFTDKSILKLIGQKFPFRGKDPISVLNFLISNDRKFSSNINSDFFINSEGAHLSIRPDKSAAAAVLISHYYLSKILLERTSKSWKHLMATLTRNKFNQRQQTGNQEISYYEKK